MTFTALLLLALACVALGQQTSPRPLAHAAEDFEEESKVSYASLSNVVGTPCDANLTEANLDMLIFLDLTNKAADLNFTAAAIQRQISSLRLANDSARGSCVRLYYYNNAYAFGYNANYSSRYVYDQVCLDYETLSQALFNVSQQLTSVASSALSLPLATAHSIFAQWDSSPRRKTLLIASGTSPRDSYSYTAPYAANMVANESVHIVTVMPRMGAYSQAVATMVASPGQALSIYEPAFEDAMYRALVNAACQCPNNSKQFLNYNAATNHFDYYADCFVAMVDPKVNYYAERSCEAMNGSLAALTSADKFSYVHEKVALPALAPLSDAPLEYNMGLHRLKNSSLAWYYYDKALAPLGAYQKWAPNASSATGQCGYVRMFGDAQYGMDLGACNKAAPYVCQLKTL